LEEPSKRILWIEFKAYEVRVEKANFYKKRNMKEESITKETENRHLEPV